MSDLELVLAASTGLLAVALLVATWKLARSRERIAELERRTERQRIVPTPADAVRTVVGTALKVKDQGFSGALRSSIDDLALWADVERPDLVRLAASDGTVTILFSDIEGSTALNHRLGDRGWVQLLSKHDRLLTRAIDAHSGHVIKTQGDGFMVAFAEASEAVGAACDIQRALSKVRPGSRLSGVKVRIGAHRGSAVHRDGDLFGRNVAYAARVAAQAEGGEVLVSEAVLDALDEGTISVAESREADLKGVPGTHQLHVLDWRSRERA
ncbi:adenylate/guanylate cyclase domain-containing protein [Aeromicrobium sp. NPDC092404]|uniref:adenylate/guanylate cyclase domain-containing protein n=1 Tax=Aeromicrobium sp. NPDC092404 TaxID=3154976 RepID=UPI0034349434